ncbi:efflux RND transporter periplasmic adaptor subunit [Chitinibacter bivalviorum]|uniref:Efflux RND transporter periplasmic adaptor subunit n=1 Tax=Chitinibacter bivalviorum TaxID=2739434 RepID=A0A7H9BK89_9NEIS|nr:efflux RND transporter periplasmic adaptor subunit [Chitinibacter bivalviorum]QLG87904.1 efflux RND transporter periplasmic adaptor subunit [Chitinibacter bivalviorum]
MQVKWLVLGLVGAALGGYAAWYRYAPLEVHTILPKRGDAIEAIYATGLVEPSVLLPIAPRVGGHLTALNVSEGQTVRKGQVLAQLEALDVVRTVDEQAARAQYAKQQQARTASLVAQGFYSGAEMDRVNAEANATQAALRRAKALQGFTTLTAPADGVILRRDAEVGQFVAAGQVLMSMSCCAPLRVSAEVDEEDIPKVKIGQQVLLHAPAFPNQVLDGHVEAMTPKGDPVSRSYRVRIALAKPADLRVGMTVEANLISQQKSHALLIPSQIIQDGKVWVLEQGKVKQNPVKLGIIGNSQSEVLSGIEDKTQLIWPIPKGIYLDRSANITSEAIPKEKPLAAASTP